MNRPFHLAGDRGALSSMVDALFVILIVTVAIVGTWSFATAGWSRSEVQGNDYDLHYTSVTLTSLLRSTVPTVTIIEPPDVPIELEDQTVLELLSLEMVLLRRGWDTGGFTDVAGTVQRTLDRLISPNHEWAFVSFESTHVSGLIDASGAVDHFLFLSSDPTHRGWGDAMATGKVITSSYSYSVPPDIAGSDVEEALSLSVYLACWAP